MLGQQSFEPTGNFKKDLQYATEFENLKHPELAAKYYPSLLASQKLDANQQVQIGLNYMKVGSFENAIQVFQLVINKYYTKLPISRYYLANAFFRNGDYNLAKSEYKSFKDNYTFSSDSFKQQVLLEYNNCDSMLFSAQKSSKSLHLCPALENINSPTENSLHEIYGIEKVDNWSNGDKITLNTVSKIIRKDNDGNHEIINCTNETPTDLCISKDGNILVFTKLVYQAGQTQSKIFYSRKSEGTWDKAVQFMDPINMSGFNSKNPSINIVQNDIFLSYASDKPNGSGGFDLYIAELNADLKVVNDSVLPTVINTTYNEIAPFYNEQNATYYFSSDRPIKTYGAYDIYSYKKEMSSTPLNLGKPFNSGADDLFYRVSNKDGYLVSNRKIEANLSPTNVYCFEVEKNELNIDVISDFKSLSIYELSVDENNIRIYSSDSSKPHSISIEQNKKYRIKVKKDNFIGVDTTLFIGNLADGEKLNITLLIQPIISIEGKVYFVDYDSSAPKVKQCTVELIDMSKGTENVLYSSIINKQNRKYTFQLPTDKEVKLKVRAENYNTYDTIFLLENFKTPGGFINNIQLHQILKNNIIFVDSLFILDDEIRSYNDFDQTIRPIANSFNKNENIRGELMIQLITTDVNKTDFAVPSALEDIINKYFVKNIYINKQVVKSKTTSRNQDWYKLYLTYK